MQGFIKKSFRNIVLITLAIIALAVLLRSSPQTRTMLTPKGAQLPPGIDR